MSRNRLRGPLAWCLTATILLPAVLTLVLGLARLLAALGDEAGATVCDRIALFSGMLWAVAIVGATICNAAVLLHAPPRGRRRAALRRRRRARRDWREWRRRVRRGRRREEHRGRHRRGRAHRRTDLQERSEGRSDPGDVR